MTQLVRSHGGGKRWSQPVIVFEGMAGEPRAAGTMAALTDGRVIALFDRRLQDSLRQAQQSLPYSEIGQKVLTLSVRAPEGARKKKTARVVSSAHAAGQLGTPKGI